MSDQNREFQETFFPTLAQQGQPNLNPALPRGPAYDVVSRPSHYNKEGGIECIMYIKQVLGLEGFVAYCRGNTIKYNHRAMYKGNPTEDLSKAQQYLQWSIDTLKEINE